MKMALLGAVVLFGLVTSSACTNADDAPAVNDTPAANVQVSSNQFTPAQVKIKVGGIVRWTWAGGSHNVVSGANCAPEAHFKSGAPISGGSFEHTFDTPGTFPYFCELHCAMGMKGEVVVEP